MPAIFMQHRANPKPYGIEIGVQPQYQQYRPLIQALNLEWIRYPVMWHKWQPDSADQFAIPAGFAEDIAAIIQDGSKPIFTVKMSPPWARHKAKPRLCDPPNPQHLADFCTRLMTSFPAVRYLELGNEMDTWEDQSPYFGCWGMPEEPYYGGQLYAPYVNLVNDSIHALNPENKILSGGLMLGALDQPMATYLKGALLAGAQFDGISFHQYVTYPNCNTTFVANAVNFIRQTLDETGHPQVPLFLTETSLLSRAQSYPNYETEPHHDFYYHQCAYLYNLLEYAAQADIIPIWYGLKMGWMNCSLLSDKGTPKPIYYMMTRP